MLTREGRLRINFHCATVDMVRLTDHIFLPKTLIIRKKWQ